MKRLLPMLAACAVLTSAATARPVRYRLPEDTTPPVLAGAAAEPVLANCAGCHSLDYLATQPRGKGPQFWRDTVNKMIGVYGAPIAAGDVETLAVLLDARLK